MNKDKKEMIKEIIIPKGTTIHLNSIPFELPKDTKVLGLKSNFKLAINWKPFCRFKKE